MGKVRLPSSRLLVGAAVISVLLPLCWCFISALAMIADNHGDELVSLLIEFPILSAILFIGAVSVSTLIANLRAQG